MILAKVAGIPEWEEALFDLFNRLRDAKTRLLVAADKPPKNLDIVLPDLVSRLSWGLVFQVQPLNDNDKVLALQLRAHLRGLDMSEEVARYILFIVAAGIWGYCFRCSKNWTAHL